MALILPQSINSVHRPIKFGIDHAYGFNILFYGVNNENGYAKFLASANNPYVTPPCQYIYVTSGIYAGLHSVKEIDSNGNILTETKMINNSSGNIRCLLNYRFEVVYSNDTLNDSFFVSPVWNSNAILIANLSPFLVSVFDSPINPPYQGIDDSLWLDFKVKLRVDEQTKAWLYSNNLIENDFILNTIGYNWNSYTFKAIRSTVENPELTNENTVSNGFMKPNGLTMPIFFTGKPVVYSKYVGGKIRNILIT